MNEREVKKALVPKLRFPAFDGAWNRSSIGSEAAIYKGRGISKADINPNGSTPCIRYGELYTIYGEIIDKPISKTDLQPSDLFFSHAGDVIIPSSGETKEDIATSSCVLRSQIALGGDLNVLRTKHDGRWLSYYIKGKLWCDISRVAQGDSVVHLYPEQIAKVRLGVPGAPEQRKIAECLQSLDELIAAESEKLKALKRHKKGLLQQLFPAEGETTPRLRFPGFRSQWHRVALSELLKESPSYGLNAPATGFRSDLPLYIRITDIDEDGRYMREGRVSVAEVVTGDAYLQPGDIAVARTGASVGKSYFCDGKDGPFVYAGFLIRLRTDPSKLLPALLAQWLRTDEYWRWVTLTSARSGQPGINGTEYASAAIPIPRGPLAIQEQIQVINCLSAEDAMINSLREKVDGLRAHKAALMQQLFPSLDETEQ